MLCRRLFGGPGSRDSVLGRRLFGGPGRSGAETTCCVVDCSVVRNGVAGLAKGVTG